MRHFDSFIAGESITAASPPGQVYIGQDGKVYNSATRTKAIANLTFVLENLHEELVGTVYAGELLTGEVRADGFFYFKLPDINGISKTCRLLVVANGLKIVEEQK